MMIKMPLALKNNVNKGYLHVQDKTISLVDWIFQLLDLKVILALIGLALISLAIAFSVVQNSPQTIVFMPEQISFLTLPDTRLQASFYRVYCVAVFAFFFIFGIFAPNWFQDSNRQHWRVLSIVPRKLIPWLPLIVWVFFLLVYDLKPRDFLLALVAAYMMAEIIHGRFSARTLAITFLLVVFILFILPFGFQNRIYDGQLWGMDIHWSAVLGDALFQKEPVAPQFDAFSNYGVLLTELVDTSRSLPPFETLGGTWTFLKLINLIFCILVFVAIVQRLGVNNMRMVWAAATLILIVFSGMITGVADYFIAPNLLPIRFLMIPVTVLLAYVVAGRNGAGGAIIFGLIAPIFVLYNFETSIYCILAVGFALFIESARRGFGNVILSGISLVISFAVSGTLVALIIFDRSLGEIFSTLIHSMAEKVNSGSSGFGSLSAYFFAPFLVIMIHCSVLFARYLLSIKEKKQLTSVEFQSIVIVGMIIAIGPYILNRYHVLNMWIPFLLYALLVLPKFVTGDKPARVFWSFVLIVMVIPFIFGNPVKRVFSERFMASLSDNFQDRLQPCLDGISAPDELCNYTLEKADELGTLTRENPDLKWISGLPLTMERLTGIDPTLDQKALFFFAHREETRNIVLQSIVELNAPLIALDKAAPGNIAGIPEAVVAFQRNLMRDAGYEIIDETKYWVIAGKQ